MSRFMLDTDLSIYVINRRPRQALDTFNAHAGEDLHQCDYLGRAAARG